MSSSNINYSTSIIATILKNRSKHLNKAMSPLPHIPIYSNLVEDTLPTVTTFDQQDTEEVCLEAFRSEPLTLLLQKLQRDAHIKFLQFHIGKLPAQMAKLDASRPWIIYWALNALCVLDADVSDFEEEAVDTIFSCISPEGGIGGNIGQIGHLAPTYAGFNVLALMGDEYSWDKIDRKAMYDWIFKLKTPEGGFKMHINGECDTRAVYCALSVASLLNILTPELVEGVSGFISRCQTFEGGFSAFPDVEAHGGYAFCALAALCLIMPPKEAAKHLNMPRLLKWLSSRQHQPEGGFSGRTNKLVDGCYNHWVGGCWALVENMIGSNDSIWDREALQNYTLYCCQARGAGGLRDKPGKSPDAYHTNYVLCGLSGAQNRYIYEEEQAKDAKLGDYAFFWTGTPSTQLTVAQGNRVAVLNPIHVLPAGRAERMRAHYLGK
ncbi:uncharacterized protein SAPINGB_P003387 [Magnusiomyces paraingens]|uniref:Protein farnesyltransferase subunit beta n=1 Tax=Magnusiomyces paraingens TaxID=2606893 RepID=A0A5E8BUJ8_9ASCO|nr:uncharacterized protein SAPINGB_P003387 [Saprochaete ingens]VVT53067.1 unnamed protein product [Saprochaete ingens]